MEESPLPVQPGGPSPARVSVFLVVATGLVLANVWGRITLGRQPTAQPPPLEARLALRAFLGSPVLTPARKNSVAAAVLSNYGSVLKTNPHDPEAVYSWAIVEYELGNREAALLKLSGALPSPVTRLLRRIYSAHPPGASLLSDPAFKTLDAITPAGPLARIQLEERLGRERQAGEARIRLARGSAARLAPIAGMGLLFVAGSLLAWLWLAIRRGIPSLGQPLQAGWSIWEAVELLVVWGAAQVAGGLLIAASLVQTDISKRSLEIVSLLGALAFAAAVAFVWFARGTSRGRPLGWGEAGWRVPKPLKSIFLGLAGYAAALPLMALASSITQSLLGNRIPANPLIGIILEASAGQRVLLVIAVVVLAPVVEETLFRGVLFGAIRNRFPFGRAALLSALIFGLGHFQPEAAPTLILLGFIMAYLYQRTGSLLTSITFHACVNGMTTLLLLSSG